MTTPAIPPVTVPAGPVPVALAQAKGADISGASAVTASKKDVAVISKEGRDALANHETKAAPPKVLSNADAALIGQGLLRSNPSHFKSYDTNGDGKLSAQEAHAAGLG